MKPTEQTLLPCEPRQSTVAGPDGPVTVRTRRAGGVLEVGDPGVGLDPHASRRGGGQRALLAGRDGGDDLVGLDRDADLLVGDPAEGRVLAAEIRGDLLERREGAGDEVRLDLDGGPGGAGAASCRPRPGVVDATCSTPDGGSNHAPPNVAASSSAAITMSLRATWPTAAARAASSEMDGYDAWYGADLGGDDRLVRGGRVGGVATNWRGRGRARHERAEHAERVRRRRAREWCANRVRASWMSR